MKLNEMTEQQLQEFYSEVLAEYQNCLAQGLNLNMSRGKPGLEQLALSDDLLNMYIDPADTRPDGVEARNYGELMGLPACRRLFAELLGVRFEQVFACGNASLTLMYDLISKAYTHGLLHSEKPWCKLEKVKFLCPSPGYDRHFKISETFGMELITVPMLESGPDMDLVEKLVNDEAVKGMWCVPKYSNPDGITYSDETIARLASMKTAAPDFTLVWDNAYCVHEFEGDFVPFANMLEICEKAGNPDRVFEFASTSKITFPGAGVACFACSETNMAYMKKLLAAQVISFDKLNQLRHVRYLQDKAHTLALMQKHAALLAPKFTAVLDALDREIAPLEIAHWTRPQGGYFISFYAMPGTAKRALALCKEAGVTMTGAGATYPYGRDPQDSNIRIAPSLPPVEELKQAMEIFCLCIRIAALEKLDEA